MSVNNIKLMATDMDGTLLDSEKNLPGDFIPWVKKHKDIKTVIASGRQYYTLEAMFESIKDNLIFIAENGGLVFENGQVIYSNEMSKSDVIKCLDVLDNIPGVALILCGAKSAYMKHNTDLVEANGHMYYARLCFTEDLYDSAMQDDIVKIAVFVEEQKAEEFLHNFPEIPDNLLTTLSGDSWIDISDKSVNKGEAIQVIQSHFNISKEESMAFGDYLNDYEMLLHCNESYAMENAHPKLKEIAKHFTDSNDNEGVMNILRQM